MVKKLGNSKIIAILMTFTLILNTLAPMSVVFAEDLVTEFNKDGIRNAELIDVENKGDEGEPVKYDGVIESVSEGKEENLITFDLSDVYETEDLFIGLKHEFYLESDEEIAILNKDDKEINVKEGYTDFFQKANEPYKIKLQKENEEVIEYTILVKTGDYIEELELNEIEKLENKTFNHGTTKKDLIEELPKKLTLHLNNSKTQKVNVEWDFTNFVENQAGEFTLAGDYDLPGNIKGEKLPVKIQLTILEETTEIPELEKLIETAKEKSAKDYTEASFQNLKTAIGEAEVAVKSNDELLIADALTNLQITIDKLVITKEDYEFDKETGTITKYNGNQTKVVIPEEIDGVEVREIGTLAFGEKALAGKKINKVTIPNTVKKINERAFYRAHLTEVILSNNLIDIGLEAFKHNEIKEIVIPESVRTIQKGAFESNKLIDVILPNELTAIKAEAFKDNNITDIVLPTDLTEIGTSAFASNEIKELNIPANLKEIKGFANNELTTIMIPNTVVKIGKAAFASNRFELIEIPNSVTHIGDQAFADMEIKELIIGNSVQEIGKKAFYKNRLQTVDVPKSTTVIKEKAFEDNRLRVGAVKIANKKSNVSLGTDAFRPVTPIFLEDLGEDGWKFEKFDIVTTASEDVLASGEEQEGVMFFNETLDTATQKLIKGGKTSFDIKVDLDTTLLINDKEQKTKEKVLDDQGEETNKWRAIDVYHEIDVNKEYKFTLERHDVKREFTVNLDAIFIDKKSLKEQLEKADKQIDLSLLTDKSEADIIKVTKKAQGVYDKEASTQEEINQITADLKETLETKKFIIEVNLNGEITKYNGDKEELIIPSQWNEMQITQINASVFANSDLKKVIIPETIKVIQENAFANGSLEKVQFEVNELTSIMQKYDYFNLNTFNELTIETEAFKNNELAEVYLPYYVNDLEDEAFAENNFEIFSVKIDNYRSKVTLGENVFGDISPTFLRKHIYEVDKTYLLELIDQYKTVDASEYTHKSYEQYQTAYDEALNVLEESSTEEEVARSIKKLLQTKESLEKSKEVTQTDLNELLESIKRLDTRDFDYDYGEFNRLITDVEEALENDLSQEQINRLHADLAKEYKELSTPAELFDYKILNNHEIAIVEYRGISSSLIIPNEIDGRKVTQIAQAAFASEGLSTVSIPRTVYKIDKLALANNSLKTIHLPESLKQLGTEVFKSNDLVEITIPGRLKVVPNQTFAGNSRMKKIYLEEGIKEINYLAFAQSRIDTINFPKSLEKIGELAFAENEITEVHLSENVLEIGASAFQNNKIEAGFATINNVQKNVQEEKNAFANNGSDSNEKIELIYNGVEETVIEIDLIDNIEVEFDTDLSEVEKTLPQEIELKINQSIKTRTMKSENVKINWSSKTYDQTKPGTYEFIGTYELPNTIEADKPEVTVQVSVLADKTDRSELEAAIKFAEEVENDPNATVEEVAFAIQKINEHLNPFKPDNDLSELEELVEFAKGIDLTNKTIDSIENLEEMINASETILENEYITQTEVDQVVIDLQVAIDGLTEIVVDFSELDQAIAAGNNADKTNKTADSIAKLEQAIEEAEAMLLNTSATQAEADAAVETLNKAIVGLVDLPNDDKVDRSVLSTILERAKATETKNKTSDSVKKLADSIKASEVVLKDKSVTQDEINQAVIVLQAAIEGLVDIPAEEPKEKLELEKTLEKVKEIDTTGKTKKSVEKLKQAIKQAEAALKDDSISQTEIDQAVEAVNAAIKRLIDIKISDEDLDDESNKVTKLGDSENGFNRETKLGKSDNTPTKEIEQALKEEVESDKDKELPSSATNIFNFFALGIILIISGLFLARRKKVN